MIKVTSQGDWSKTMNSLKKMERPPIFDMLESFGQRGVDALSRQTPYDTGGTANSWYYEIKKTRTGYAIEWHNGNVNKGANVAVLIQYGHATGTGGYVQGIDYINPAIRPVFDQISAEITRALKA